LNQILEKGVGVDKEKVYRFDDDEDPFNIAVNSEG
jgi:hypothetical protein